MKSTITQLIQQVAKIPVIKAIYWLTLIRREEQNLFVIITETGTPLQQVDLNDIFKQHPLCIYRIYEEAYALQQLQEGNIFFLQCFQDAYLQFGALNIPSISVDFEEISTTVKAFYKKEYTKALDFQAGAHFNIEKRNYPQAAFMLHQAIELAFRTAELLTMGKEKICHHIANHQTYIQFFVPKLGQLFKTESEIKELNLLDAAYREVRYDRDYKISPTSIELFQYKLSQAITIVEEEFNLRYSAYKGAAETAPDEKINLHRKLQQLIDLKLKGTPFNSNQLAYKAEFRIDGIADIMYNIMGNLKVCIVALDHADAPYHRLIPQPHLNVQTALEHILQLLPIDEMETLEDLIKESQNKK